MLLKVLLHGFLDLLPCLGTGFFNLVQAGLHFGVVLVPVFLIFVGHRLRVLDHFFALCPSLITFLAESFEFLNLLDTVFLEGFQ